MACDGCRRTCIFSGYTSNSEHPSFEPGFKNHIMEALLDECFTFYRSYAPGAGLEPPEYLMKIDYWEELDEGHVLPDGQKLLLSSELTLRLYYNGAGGSKELVETWRTVKPARDYGDLPEESLPNPGTGYSYHVNNMCDNRGSVLRRVRPISLTLLNGFERRPHSCVIDPERDEVYIGDEMEIEVRDLLDIEDKLSREFNRIVVQAVEGEILNGEPLEADEDLKAFKVGDGRVTVKYKAPQDRSIKEDTIYVNNSCTISREDEYPLSKTGLDRKIGEKRIAVKCDDFEASISVSLDWERENEDEKETGSYSVNVSGTLEFWPEFSMSGVTQYRPKELEARYSLKSLWYLKDPPNCKDSGRRTLRREESAEGSVPITYAPMAPMANHLKVQPMQKLMDESLPDVLSQFGGMLPAGLGEQIANAMKQAGELMSDRYELLLTTGFSPRQYKKVVKTVCKGGAAQRETEDAPIMDGFGLHIHSKMQDEDSLSGSRSWRAEVVNLGSSIDIDDLAEGLGGRPLRPSASEDGHCNYTVSWELRRVKG